jgi:hypothetical protein
VKRGIQILKKGGFYGVQIEVCFDILQGSGVWERVANFAAWSKGGLVYHNMRTPNEKREKGRSDGQQFRVNMVTSEAITRRSNKFASLAILIGDSAPRSTFLRHALRRGGEAA